MVYKVQVIADNSGVWAGNGLTFDDFNKACEYARDLFSRWTAVREWRVINSETGEVVKEVNFFDNSK